VVVVVGLCVCRCERTALTHPCTHTHTHFALDGMGLTWKPVTMHSPSGVKEACTAP
jgi:hypothetical protein